MLVLNEVPGGFDLQVAQAKVEMVSLAWCLDILVTDDKFDRLLIKTGSSMSWTRPGREPVVVDPERGTADLGALMVALRHAPLVSLAIRAGNLIADFGDSGEIVIAPHPRFEAWETGGGFKLVCLPGGEVAIWSSADSPEHLTYDASVGAFRVRAPEAGPDVGQT